jgi:hypothetical protein
MHDIQIPSTRCDNVEKHFRGHANAKMKRGSGGGVMAALRQSEDAQEKEG